MTDATTFRATGLKYSIDTDPDAELDYKIEWDDWLTPLLDTIESVEVIDDGNVTVILQTGERSSIYGDAMRVLIWLGPRIGDAAKATTICRIHTVGGRTEDQSFTLKFKEK